MSNYNMILENQVEMVELSDEAMEAVSGGQKLTIELETEIPEIPLDRGNDDE